jgi:hypothetical protein
MIKRINAPVMRAAMPSSEAPLAAVAMASPITSGPLHLENPRVVGISPTSPATLKTPQASSAAAWWSRVVTVQIGPRHAVAPVTMVASQIAQKSSTGTRAQSAHRSRLGTGTRSRLQGRLRSTKSDSMSEFALGDNNRGASCSATPSWRRRKRESILRLSPPTKPRWLPSKASRTLNTAPTSPSPIR